MDKHCIGPELFDTKIKSAIKDTNCIVLLVTRDCFIPKKDEDDWFLKEIKTAFEYKKTIIPVLFDEIKTVKDIIPMSQMSEFFSEDEILTLVNTQSIRYSQEYSGASIEKLVSFIRKTDEGKKRFERVKKWLRVFACVLVLFVLFLHYVLV